MELARRGPAAAVRRAAAAAGGAALLAQVVLLRELLASSHGNELILGLALAAWLCLTGAASALGARRRGPGGSRLALLLAVAPLLLLASLWLTRLTSPSVLGQEVSLPILLLAALAVLLPASVLGGLSFTWATQALTAEEPATAIYVAETVGSALAGVLFHFFLAERVHAVWILSLAGSVAALAGAALAWPSRKLSVLAGLSVGVAILAAPAVDRSLVRARFPGERVLAVEPTRYGLLAVVARGEQRIFFHDGVLLFTSEDEVTATEVTHLPLLLHPRPKRILFAGGGLAGGLAQALEHGPERIDYAELDPALVPLAREYAGERTRAALADGRVHAQAGDARAALRGVVGRYDVILVHLPVAQNARVARISTREFFADARRALAPGGLLAVVTPGADAHLDEAARYRHASLWATMSRVFPAVAASPGAQTVLWASESTVVARPGLLVRRMQERRLRPLHIGPTWLVDRLLPFNTAAYRRALASVPGLVNTDRRPVVYLFGLLEGLERVWPSAAHAALWLVRAPWQGWGLGGALLGCALLAWGVRRRGWGPGLAAAVAGGTGMSLELVLMLAYQSLAGHLYHALGAMLAGFMAGMAVGATLGRRFVSARRALAFACAVTAAVAISTLAVMAGAQALPGASFILILGGIVLAGAATGAVYPLAVVATGGDRAAAHVYAWDLVGAAAAALLVAMLAVPLLGLSAVVALAAVLCVAAAAANVKRR